jgi:hypothetical protein
MIEATGSSIENDAQALAFRTRAGSGSTGWNALADTALMCKVEARALGGHQKEALVTEGAGGACWRMVSDEGPILGGTDLAPFPLGFFSAGLQSDLLGRIQALAPSFGVQLDNLELQVLSRYTFSGSFFAGTGHGATQPVDVKMTANTSASASTVASLLVSAVNASPAFGALRQSMTNNFALYVNGKRSAVQGVEACTQPDQTDPFVAHRTAPTPDASLDHRSELIKRIHAPQTASAHMPSDIQKFEIVVGGTGTINPVNNITTTLTWLQQPLGSQFALTSDQNPHPQSAPTGLSYLAAAVSFCYMTQLLRYIDYQKLKVNAVRLVQINPFSMACAQDGQAPKGACGPFETHLYLNGSESEDVMQKLLFYSARTCYLHAALTTPYEPTLQLNLNGKGFVSVA